MTNNEFKKGFKDEVKEFWSEYGDKIKIGAKCLGIGLTIGFIKGAFEAFKMTNQIEAQLIEKIPYTPDCEDVGEYVWDHIDELKPLIETTIEEAKEFESI